MPKKPSHKYNLRSNFTSIVKPPKPKKHKIIPTMVDASTQTDLEEIDPFMGPPLFKTVPNESEFYEINLSQM